MNNETQQHTPEPWYACINVNDKTTFAIDSTNPRSAYIADDLREEDADRIVACVNACKNVPNEWLQENAVYALIDERDNYKRIINEDIDAMAALQEERNKLLKASEYLLKSINAWFTKLGENHPNYPTGDITQAVFYINEAITKAKGGING
jgi:hypothetical protein